MSINSNFLYHLSARFKPDFSINANIRLMQLSVDFFYQLGINELQKKFGWGSATSRTYSVSVDVVFVAWDDIGTGAFGPEVEQSVSDLAV